MHLLLRETHGLEEGETAIEPGGAPADILFLSFSDSDLSAAAAALLPNGFPSVRLERIGRYLHPLSVDLLCERLVAGAKVVVIRLLGGLEYWRYGVEEIAATCAASGIPLAVLPGDGPQDDPKLATISTMAPAARLAINACLRQSGAENMARALQGAAHAAGLWVEAPAAAVRLPDFGLFTPRFGSDRAERAARSIDVARGLDPRAYPFGRPNVVKAPQRVDARVKPSHDQQHPTAHDRAWAGCPDAAIIFYRSHLLAGETATVEALSAALAKRGLGSRALFVDSLKNPAAAAFVRDWLIAWHPATVLNLTGFSARLGDAPSPLEAAGVPVLQLVQAGTSRRPGPCRRAVCRRPIWRCRWCCPKRMGGC